MSKRDIKAKRWAKNKAAVGAASPFDKLTFRTQARKFGDGRWQYRDGLPSLRGGSKITWGLWHDC